jgi:hypothetical protein
MNRYLNRYLQPAALGILLLGAGLVSAQADNSTSARLPAAIAASANDAGQKPLVLAQIPEVQVQVRGEGDRHMDRRHHDRHIVIVSKRHHETIGVHHNQRRDRDHDHYDHH